jgi:opacity protein-like surface antigen
MKTKRTLVLILLVISVSASAQSIYLRGGLGIAICTAPHMIYQSTTGSGESEPTIESKRGGLGTGMPFLVAAGYNLSDNFAVELGVDYFLGFNTKCVNTDGSYSGTIKNSGSMLALVPAFVMKFDLDKFKPYARLGIKVGVWNTAKTKETETGPDEDLNRISKDYGGIAIGAQAAAGVEYALSDLLSLFGEINLDGISYAPTKGKFTKLTNNGVNELSNMTTKEKTWLYVKNLDESQSIPDSDPDKETKVNYSFANVGLIVGVKINLGK